MTPSALRSPPLLGQLRPSASLILVLLIHSTPGGYADVIEDHECLRSCTRPPRPMVCRYEFTLEWYHTMSTACRDCPYNVTDCYRPHCIPANGVLRSVAVVNRQFPGPAIHVCQFDTIEVKVRNNLLDGEGIAIHWHGVHQRGTPHMDGVPLVTQCPIPYRSSFTYRFQADMAGTFFWHAHGIPRVEGAAGPLVIRQPPPDDVHSGLYDCDLPQHTIMVQDWLHRLFMDRYNVIVFYDLAPESDSILINGRGRYRDFVDPNTNQTVHTPRHTIHVQRGKRYRLRLISNSLMECPFTVSVDGHGLTVIASDGFPVQALPVRKLGIESGERYDVVLETGAAAGKYWLRLAGLRWCEGMSEMALVVYEGAEEQPDPLQEEEEEEESQADGIHLNPLNMETSATVLNAKDMVAAGNQAEIGPADVVHYISLTLALVGNDNIYHPVHNPAFEGDGNATRFVGGVPSPQINYVTHRPPTRPLLTQSRENSEYETCTFRQAEAMRDHCRAEFCECTQVLEVKLGQVVELVLVDEGALVDGSHPMHVHGYAFQIVASGKLGHSTTLEEVMRLDREGGITRRTVNAPTKDTVVTPDGGYLVVRFVADNPGWWLFHCHVELHLLAGMAMVIHVGTDDDLPPIPKDLPRCGGDWYPKDDGGKDAPTKDAPKNVAGTRQGGVLTYGMLLICNVVTLLALIFQ